MCREAGGHGCPSHEENRNMLLIPIHPHVVRLGRVRHAAIVVATFRPLSLTWWPTAASSPPAPSQGLPQNTCIEHSQYCDSDKLRQKNSTLTTLYPAFGELIRHILIVGAWTEYIMSTQLRHGRGINPSILCGYIWLNFIHLRPCLEPQLTAAPPKMKVKPVVERRVSWSPAQSASLKPRRTQEEFLSKTSPLSIEPLTYRRTCLIAAQCSLP